MTIEEALEIFRKEIECEYGATCQTRRCEDCLINTTGRERMEAVRTVYEHLKEER